MAAEEKRFYLGNRFQCKQQASYTGLKDPMQYNSILREAPRALVHAEYTGYPSLIQNIKEHSNSALKGCIYAIEKLVAIPCSNFYCS